MYDFIDINESPFSDVLPSEALRFNGEYFEHIIPGYRTIYVKGRETPERAIEYDEVGINDGGVRKSTRYPPRTITVGYQLIAESNLSFRLAYNRLLGLLHAEEAELIFRDEADKYYTGTMQAMGDIESGRNAVVGEIEFLCVDPFKRSVEEVTVLPDSKDKNQFHFAYNGAIPVAPSFTVRFDNKNEDDEQSSSCGYVAFMDEEANTLQFGNLDEVDGASTDNTKTLTNQAFTAYSGKIAERWERNKAIPEPAYGSSFSQEGSLTIKADETSRKEKMLSVGSYGTGSKWRGAGICRTLPETAANFKLTYKQRMCIGSTAQRGIFVASLADSSDKVIASVVVVKAQAGGSGNVHIYVNGERQKKQEISLSRYNTSFGYKKSGGQNPNKTTTITKSGSKWAFDVAGTVLTCTVPETATMAAAKVSFYIGKFQNYNGLSTNGLYSAKLESIGNGENTFSTGDVLEVECGTGEIFLNDFESPNLGSIVNDWEEFLVQPGENTIKIDKSDWANMPDITLRFREVFL